MCTGSLEKERPHQDLAVETVVAVVEPVVVAVCADLMKHVTFA